MTLRILYQDDDLVAVDKPAGLLVHRTRIADEDAAALQQVRDLVGRRVNPVHRLDRPTSGVLLFAFEADTTRLLQTMFNDGRAHKRYLAVVRGYAPEQGVIDRPLRQDRHKPERPARTIYRRLRTAEAPFPAGRYDTARFSLLEAEPLTGRLHQIRRHCAHIRHPVIGDTTHGDGKQNRAFREHVGVHRLLLMARSLSLPHPRHGERLHLFAPLPEDFELVCRTLGWPSPPDQDGDDGRIRAISRPCA